MLSVGLLKDIRPERHDMFLVMLLYCKSWLKLYTDVKKTVALKEALLWTCLRQFKLSEAFHSLQMLKS